jgi:hypothetical protein
VTQRYQSEVAYVSCAIAGATGGLSSLICTKLWAYFYKKRCARGFNSILLSLKYDVDTQFSDPNESVPLFATCRGIIAGCVIVSSAGIYYKLWISAILGIFAGMIYVGSCMFFKKLKIDDPLHIA